MSRRPDHLDQERLEALIAGRCFAEAAELLEESVRKGANSEALGLLGLVRFHLEDYAEAERLLQRALMLGPGTERWRIVGEHARANAVAGVQAPVPQPGYFQREPLLAAPPAAAGDLPPPLVLPGGGLFAGGLDLAGDVIGRGLGLVGDLLVHAYGFLAGYQDEVWTNWYRRGRFRALLSLAYMRDLLNRRNLVVSYPRGVLVGFQPSGQRAPAGARCFRTADGSWNNLADPMEGAAGTRFLRNVALDAIHPERGERLLTPNPRRVSLALLTRQGGMQEVPFLNLLAAAWIQFQVHDWVSHGDNLGPPDTIEMSLAEDDPARVVYGQRSMAVGGTQPDPTRRREGEPAPVSYINEVTHWWDGSQVYGSDPKIQHRLRSHVDGKLAMAEGLLPCRSGVEDVGFVRNWWVGLGMLHTLFVREHNAICERLKGKYPGWDDERLFHVARLVNAAVMAKIHTIEWTPALLPQQAADLALNANWYGLATYLLRSRKQRKARSTFNIRQPELGGVVGNPIDRHGSAYGLTEEFVEVYRLHSLMPDTLVLRSRRTGDVIKRVPVAETRQAGSAKLTRIVDMADLFYSFGNQHPGQLVLNNYPRFMQTLSMPGNPVFDLGAVDILRARERGVPRYNEFRRQLGLKAIRSFDDLTRDPRRLASLKDVYGDGTEAVENLDLLIGTLAEDPQDPPVRPTGFAFGETLFQIFILNATRRLQADRFYTDCYNEETYTAEGLDWIDDVSLKTVILRHYPELAETGLANVTNAFEPWDTAERLDPRRHPLRAWDADLQPDPWMGDAYRFKAPA
ncbi:MAG: peroxidase family protein [Arenicellales bacterium]